ncbi:MAG: hypothetical protein KJP12_04225 [Acidimicrobiia bacterium]|nr:hypothetical protein [Acidimicrobiia bacterium]MBT8214409.1 hypothetical protein [Acidimicrobiia bacterium]NNF68702.1 hypothetical protein [Acidimicrobiia bacterium]NNK90921.1 hypothetical protein [Acidimicrobiia bacterium]
MRTTLLIIHILAAGTWIGANVTQLALERRMSADGGPTAATWQRSRAFLGKSVYPAAAVTLLITGIWLVIDSAVYDWENAFVAIGFLMVAIGAGLGIAVMGPLSERAVAIHDTGQDMNELPKVTSRLQMWGGFDTLLLVITVAAMTGKWGV